MTPLLVFGFLMGARHALEADHVAAVATLAVRSRSLRNTVGVATVWGCGHTAALVLFGSLMAALDAALPELLARFLEAAAGATLVVLGFGVLRRLRKERVHFHVHHHDGGVRHFHAHGHAGETTHDPLHHRHEHPEGLFGRALLVGGVHGMAGSAALTLLSLQTIGSFAGALAYLLVFGAGSILGMILFSVVISVPMRHSARHLRGAFRGLEAALGMTTIALGVWVAQAAVFG